MKQIVIITLISIIIIQISAQTTTNTGYKDKIEAINKIPLCVTYLLPVDSLGGYIDGEFLSPEMCHHSELATDIAGKSVGIFAIVYFDDSGKVRKTIKTWADGGDLNNIAYYDESGNIIYAVYSKGSEDHGRLYVTNSCVHIEHSFSDREFHSGFCLEINMTTNDLANVYKADLVKPDHCNSVIFASIKKGDKAFVCTKNVYTSPNGSLLYENEDEISVYVGKLVVVDSIKNNWCEIKTVSGTFIGYVPVTDVEVIKIKP